MKTNFIKYLFFIFVIIIMGVAIYKFTEQEKEAKEETTNVSSHEEEVIKEINLGIAEYDTMNPILSNNKHIQEISKIIFDSLLEIDEEYKIQNGLAKDWAKTSNTTYLIKLRDDIKWSDGQEFTPDDVIFTIDILKNVRSIYSYNVQYITRVDKIDENTLQITLDHEIPFFEYNLIFPVMSKNFYEEVDFMNTDKNNMPIGTGKYKISENDGDGILLEKNENYKGDDLTLEKINIGRYSNLGELYNAFKLGKIDLITTNNTKIEDYIGNIGYNSKETFGRNFDFIALNTNNTILAHKEIRQALSFAINKESIAGALFNNKYKVQNYPLDFGSYLKGEPGEVGYNLDRARQILEENGWSFKYNKWQKTENYRTKSIYLRLVVQEGNGERSKTADIIKANIEELGIPVEIIKISDSQYNSYLENKNYDMIITGITQTGNPNLEYFFGSGNPANYYNDEVSSIINDVKNISKEDLLKEKYSRLRAIYNDDVPYIGLYSNYYAIMTNWSFKGNVTPNWYNIFMDVNNWYKN